MALGAVRLGGVDRRRASAAQDVDMPGDWLQVRDIRAMAYPAKVIELQPAGDRSGEHLVHQPVNGVITATDLDPAVAAGSRAASPQQTAGGVDDQLREQPLAQG